MEKDIELSGKKIRITPLTWAEIKECHRCGVPLEKLNPFTKDEEAQKLLDRLVLLHAALTEVEIDNLAFPDYVQLWITILQLTVEAAAELVDRHVPKFN
jgi:hypothetical protein